MRSFIIGTVQQILFGTSNREMRWAGQVASMGENRGGGKLEGKRALRKTMSRWEDYIKMDLQEVGFGGVDWIDLA
jgi:hypothetical protein